MKLSMKWTSLQPTEMNPTHNQKEPPIVDFDFDPDIGRRQPCEEHHGERPSQLHDIVFFFFF